MKIVARVRRCFRGKEGERTAAIPLPWITDMNREQRNVAGAEARRRQRELVGYAGGRHDRGGALRAYQRRGVHSLRMAFRPP